MRLQASLTPRLLKKVHRSCSASSNSVRRSGAARKERGIAEPSDAAAPTANSAADATERGQRNSGMGSGVFSRASSFRFPSTPLHNGDAFGGLGFASLVKNVANIATPKATSRALGDGKLVRSEFVDLCIDVMWGLPVENLKMAVENYLGAKSMETRRNAAYWQARELASLPSPCRAYS